MTRRLPPLNQLRAFEAAARHASFKAAAEELHVTHAAISHQIKALEEGLGIRLFDRQTRKVILRAEAADLARALTRQFDAMDRAVSQISNKRTGGTLRISAAPFYTNRILVPLLARMADALPGLRVELDLSGAVIDLRQSDFDGALRYGAGDWPDLTIVPLHNDEVQPFAARSLIGDRKLPMDPEDIAKFPLSFVRGSENMWQDWFAAVGSAIPGNLNAIGYEDRARGHDLALSGNGISLSDWRLALPDVRSGALVPLHPYRLKTNKGMHFVYPRSELPDPRVKAFADWLQAELPARLTD